MPRKKHKEWHEGAGGGAFNDEWTKFIDLEPHDSPYTKEQILDELLRIREKYPLD